MTPLAQQLIANLGQSPAPAPVTGGLDPQSAMMAQLMQQHQAQGALPGGAPAVSPWGGLSNIGSKLQSAAQWVKGLIGGQ